MTLTGVVDALRDAHRRLESSGRLLALVPAGYRPSVACRGRWLGRIDDTPFRPAIHTAEDGLRHAVASGLYRPVFERTIDVIERADDGPALLSAVPPGWRIGRRLEQALDRARAPVVVHKRSVLSVLVRRERPR